MLSYPELRRVVFLFYDFCGSGQDVLNLLEDLSFVWIKRLTLISYKARNLLRRLPALRHLHIIQVVVQMVLLRRQVDRAQRNLGRLVHRGGFAQIVKRFAVGGHVEDLCIC